MIPILDQPLVAGVIFIVALLSVLELMTLRRGSAAGVGMSGNSITLGLSTHIGRHHRGAEVFCAILAIGLGMFLWLVWTLTCR